MGVLQDGLFILKFYWAAVLIFFVSVLGFGGWGMRFFEVHEQRSFLLKLSFVLSFGSIVLVWLAFGLVLFDRLGHPMLKYGSLLMLGVGLVAMLDWIRREKYVGRQFELLFICWFLATVLLVRLAYLRGIVLPPYADSPEHYLIVQDFLTSAAEPSAFYSIDTIENRYYHFGFHSVAAWITSASGLDAADSISLLGQLFLVILPISTFALVYSATQNSTAGFVTMLFAAFAWRMPAFAANWGKYPAIAGLSLFPAVVGLWIFCWRRRPVAEISHGMLLVATTGLVLVHTRLVICMLLVLISFFIIRILLSLTDIYVWKVSLLVLLSVAAFLSTREYLMTFYENGYYLALALVLFLLPFAFSLRAELSLSILFFILGASVLSHISITVHEYDLALLDQPFLEILLCIPLSLLGGIGFAGLLNEIQQPAGRRLTFFALLALLLFSFVSADSVYPDPCCNYVRASDLQAIQWLEKNTPGDAVIWIAAFRPNRYRIATDSGVWIHALTGRNVNKLGVDFQWSAPNSIQRICRPNYENVYIYRGTGLHSFEEKKLAEQNWLTAVFTSGESTVYQLNVPCAQ